MKEFFEQFIDGFFSVLIALVTIGIVLLPLFFLSLNGSAWWIVVFIVNICIFGGLARAL